MLINEKALPFIIEGTQSTTGSKKVAENCALTLPTAIKSLNHLIDLGIVTEITGKARNKIYVYKKYLDILSEGTTPIKE